MTTISAKQNTINTSATTPSATTPSAHLQLAQLALVVLALRCELRCALRLHVLQCLHRLPLELFDFAALGARGTRAHSVERRLVLLARQLRGAAHLFDFGVFGRQLLLVIGVGVVAPAVAQL